MGPRRVHPPTAIFIRHVPRKRRVCFLREILGLTGKMVLVLRLYPPQLQSLSKSGELSCGSKACRNRVGTNRSRQEWGHRDTLDGGGDAAERPALPALSPPPCCPQRVPGAASWQAVVSAAERAWMNQHECTGRSTGLGQPWFPDLPLAATTVLPAPPAQATRTRPSL